MNDYPCLAMAVGLGVMFLFSVTIVVRPFGRRKATATDTVFLLEARIARGSSVALWSSVSGCPESVSPRCQVNPDWLELAEERLCPADSGKISEICPTRHLSTPA
jgi:hypothetical protein